MSVVNFPVGRFLVDALVGPTAVARAFKSVTPAGGSKPNKPLLTPCLTRTGDGLSNGIPVTLHASQAKRRSRHERRTLR